MLLAGLRGTSNSADVDSGDADFTFYVKPGKEAEYSLTPEQLVDKITRLRVLVKTPDCPATSSPPVRRCSPMRSRTLRSAAWKSRRHDDAHPLAARGAFDAPGAASHPPSPATPERREALRRGRGHRHSSMLRPFPHPRRAAGENGWAGTRTACPEAQARVLGQAVACSMGCERFSGPLTGVLPTIGSQVTPH